MSTRATERTPVRHYRRRLSALIFRQNVSATSRLAGLPVGGGRPDASAETRWYRWTAVFVSVVFHISILLVLAALFVRHRRPPPPVGIQTELGARQAGEEPFEQAALEAASAGSDDSQATFALTSSTVEMLPEARVGLGAQLSGMSDDGAGSGGGGDGAGSGVGFFGTRSTGLSFVFVVDRSGSMRGHRFERARRELIRALSELTPEQKFFVILYNRAAFPMPTDGSEKRLMYASTRMRARVGEWIDRQSATGGTVPDSSLKMALQMKPDVIFLLSDGEFDRTARTVAQEANTHGTIIHTIAFESREGEVILKGIAQDNHGRYRYVE